MHPPVGSPVCRPKACQPSPKASRLFRMRLTDRLCRSDDLLARIGDEFVMVLADVDQDQARLIAGRLCDRLQDSWTISCGPLRTTSSVGVALYPRDGDSAHTLLRRADEALYAAKRAGRSQAKFICKVAHG